MAQVRFWRGDYAKYKLLPIDDSTVYFVTNIDVDMDNPSIIVSPYSAIIIGKTIIASSRSGGGVGVTDIESIIGKLSDLSGELNGKNVIESLNFLLGELKVTVSDNGTNKDVFLSDLIVEIDGQVSLIASDIININTEIEDIKINISSLQSAVDVINGSISALEEQVNANNNDLILRIDTIDGELINILTNVDTNNSEIESLRNLVGTGEYTANALIGKSLTDAVSYIANNMGSSGGDSSAIIGNLDNLNPDIKDINIVASMNKIDNKSKFESMGTSDTYIMTKNYQVFTYEQVKDKTAEQILDMMLFPDTLPSKIVAPSVQITMSNTTPLMEIGENINSILTANYNQGSIEVPDILDTKRSYGGDATNYAFNGPGVVAATTSRVIRPMGTKSTNTYTLSNYKVANGINSWGVDVTYGDGEIPVSAKGNLHPELQKKSGVVKSSLYSVYGVYPIFTNKEDILVLSKEPLVRDTVKSFDITYNQANNSTNRFKIAVPYIMGDLIKVELWNGLSNDFAEPPKMPFERLGTQSIQVQGVDVSYVIWSCTQTSQGKGTRYRFTFA